MCSRLMEELRTASVTGGFLALIDALHAMRRELPDPRRFPVQDSVAAVSVGIVDDAPTLDLDYQQDSAASVDMNVVMTGIGRFVEVQGTGEESTFSEDDLQHLLQLARHGIVQLTKVQLRGVRPAVAIRVTHTESARSPTSFGSRTWSDVPLPGADWSVTRPRSNRVRSRIPARPKRFSSIFSGSNPTP